MDVEVGKRYLLVKYHIGSKGGLELPTGTLLTVDVDKSTYSYSIDSRDRLR